MTRLMPPATTSTSTPRSRSTIPVTYAVRGSLQRKELTVFDSLYFFRLARNRLALTFRVRGPHRSDRHTPCLVVAVCVELAFARTHPAGVLAPPAAAPGALAGQLTHGFMATSGKARRLLVSYIRN